MIGKLPEGVDEHPRGAETGGAVQPPPPIVDIDQTRRFLEELDPDHGTTWHFRTLPEGRCTGSGRNYAGTLDDVLIDLQLDNGNGRGVFVVVNEGGHRASEICRVRALFADVDDVERVAALRDEDLLVAGHSPHVVIESSPGRRHYYWLADDVPLEKFTSIQKVLAEKLGADPSVTDLPRLMRLPGFVNHKRGSLARLLEARHDCPVTWREVSAQFCPGEKDDPIRTVGGLIKFDPLRSPLDGKGQVVEVARHADLLALAGRLARQVVFERLHRSSALTTIHSERSLGRWTRDVSDTEIIAALDGAIEKCRSGEWTPAGATSNNLAHVTQNPTLTEALTAELIPFMDEDFEKAIIAHPHVFESGESGMFPLREVTLVAAPGREGKTYAMVHAAVACALGRNFGVLAATNAGRVIIYSNEDDRTQYARKVMAACTLSRDDTLRLISRIIVPNLEVPHIQNGRHIVEISERRRPIPAPMVDALIEAIRPMTLNEDPVRLIIFETASTLSDADEDNPGLKTLAGALKRIARELGVAVVLVHHTSQLAAQNLPAMKISIADIRGGTALAFNARQCFLLVNLGSKDDPFPGNDMRTHLRAYVAPFTPGRVTALICLDSSKAMDPPPVFLAWQPTKFGPAMSELGVPAAIDGKAWRKVQQIVREWGKEQHEGAKAKKSSTDIQLCIDVAAELHAAGKQPTVRAVSERLGHGADWAKSRLKAAVELGGLQLCLENVPRTKGLTDVYRPISGRRIVDDEENPSEIDE